MPIPYAKIIVNPVAGASSTHRKWRVISKLLKRFGLSYDYDYTDGVGHAIELAKDAANDGYPWVVAVGGDGTVNEVANGLLHVTGSDTALGVISTGTGSDFIRSTGVSQRYTVACSSLSRWRKSLIDIGVVEYHHNGKLQKRFFVNAAGVGFDASVVKATERLPKVFGGTIPYLTGLMSTLFTYQNKPVVLRVDERLKKISVLSIVLANGRYFGGGMFIAPDAHLDDGLLDMIIVGDIGKLELLKALPMVYRGTHGNHPKVSIEKVTGISIDSEKHVLVHADGELLGEAPANFRLIPAALNVIA